MDLQVVGEQRFSRELLAAPGTAEGVPVLLQVLFQPVLEKEFPPTLVTLMVLLALVDDFVSLEIRRPRERLPTLVADVLPLSCVNNAVHW